MILSLLIAILAGFPGMLLQMHVSTLQYVLISFVCLFLSCLLTVVSLPTYCLTITVLAFSLIFIVYMLMLFLRPKQMR